MKPAADGADAVRYPDLEWQSGKLNSRRDQIGGVDFGFQGAGNPSTR